MENILTKTTVLSTKANLPLVGLGTWNLKGESLKPVIQKAIKLGCRHIDCAAIYENEKQIGDILRDIFEHKQDYGVDRGNVSRKMLFLTHHSSLLPPNYGIPSIPETTSSKPVIKP